MNELSPDAWVKAVESWLNHGEGAQLSDEELIRRMAYPDGLRELVEKVMGEKG